jgi:penicillin-binding protein 2
VPSSAPHPTGVLTLTDALERSCNPYFESIAYAMGPQQLSAWYSKFGLGRKTGIGIKETAGRIPVSDDPAVRSPFDFANWMAGIGQGPVSASPLQMANVAATIARDGVWLRPRLLAEASAAAATRPSTRDAARDPARDTPDRVDLMLPPDALKAVKKGMVRVVNSRAGSGSAARREDMLVAGKTGSATAAPTKVNVIDPVTKQVVRGPDGPKREYLRPSTLAEPNPATPWYRGTGHDGTDLTHAWFIGFAPAEDPQIAFAVMVEYGGGGGGAAGSVANEIIQLCIDHKYLAVPAKKPKQQDDVAAAGGGELLRPIAAARAGNQPTHPVFRVAR